MLVIQVAMKRAQVNVRLTDDLERKLAYIVDRTDIPKSTLVKKYLKLGLEWEEESLHHLDQIYKSHAKAASKTESEYLDPFKPKTYKP